MRVVSQVVVCAYVARRFSTSETLHAPVSARRLFNVPPALGALRTVVRENERISNRLGSLMLVAPSARAVEDCRPRGCGAAEGVMASCDGGGFLDCVSVVDASRAARDMSRRGCQGARVVVDVRRDVRRDEGVRREMKRAFARVDMKTSSAAGAARASAEYAVRRMRYVVINGTNVCY